MMMLYYELKKIISRPINKIAFIMIIVVLGFVSYLAVADVEYVDENGHSSIGIASARALKAKKISGQDTSRKMYF